ncbi:MAG: hypothetical protein ACI81W_003423, partial [Saprospiraceae bacterium]
GLVVKIQKRILQNKIRFYTKNYYAGLVIKL